MPDRRKRPTSAPRRIYRKRPVQKRSKTTVDVILDAAALILGRTGYEGFTTNHVAKVAGVSIGSVYQYFPSKEALVAALLDRHADNVVRRIQKGVRELPVRSLDAVVRCYVYALMDAHRADPALHRVFVEQLPRSGSFVEKTEAGMTRAVARMRDYFDAQAYELSSQDHELSAFIVVHAVDALTHAAVVSRPDLLARDDFVSEVARLVMNYLKPFAACAQASTG